MRIESSGVSTIGGVAPQMDDTDKQAVSIYGKASVAGDTAVLVDSTGRVILAAGTAADSLGKAEDAPHVSGDTGVLIFAVRQNSAAALAANADYIPVIVDTNGGLWVSLSTKIAGEDLTNDRMLTMPKYTYSAVTLVDVQVKAGAGILHSVTFAPNDATPTAGSIIIYDSLTETGTVMFNWNVAATAFIPFTVVLDYAFSTGCYIGFTTTGDVNVSCAFL